VAFPDAPAVDFARWQTAAFNNYCQQHDLPCPRIPDHRRWLDVLGSDLDKTNPFEDDLEYRDRRINHVAHKFTRMYHIGATFAYPALTG